MMGKLASKTVKSSLKKLPKTDEVARLEAQKTLELQNQLNTGIKVGSVPVATSGLVSDEGKQDIEALEALAKDQAQKEKEEETADKEEKEDAEIDPKEELRIRLMQYLNPRIIKSQELKDYVNRSSLKEEIIATLNQIANHKLELYKVALASSTPVELSEGNKATKEKSKNVQRQIGTNAFIKSLVPMGPESALQRGRMVMNNPKVSSQKIAGLYRTLPSFRTHLSLHATPDQSSSQTEVDQLDEANRNPNVIKQGRTKVVKARVRKGKVQRRKRVSAVKGYTIRGGKLKRMSVAERLRRKRGQRRGKIKRKAKMARALMRRKRSMRRRASLGLKE